MATKRTQTTKKQVAAPEPALQTQEPMIKEKTTNAFRAVYSSLKGKGYAPVLVILLIIASYLLGMLTTKVQYLQQGGYQGNNPIPVGQQPQAQNPNQPSQPTGPVNVSVGHFPVQGNPNAKVTIVEFADFRCPFCERSFTDTIPQIKKDYIDTGKVKFYFRQFPFLGPASNVAADAAECANDQGQFWPFHDYLYKNQPSETDTSMYNTQTLTQAATSLGMDGSKFQQCLDSKQDDAKAQADMADGQKAGVSGTPTFFINGQQLVGAQPYASFKALIDQELAKK